MPFFSKCSYCCCRGILKTVEFLGNGEFADFPLCIRRKRFENNLFVKAPDEFRAEKPVKFGDNRPFERGEREPCRA